MLLPSKNLTKSIFYSMIYYVCIVDIYELLYIFVYFFASLLCFNQINKKTLSAKNHKINYVRQHNHAFFNFFNQKLKKDNYERRFF